MSPARGPGRALLALAALAVLGGGCTAWPPPGVGGMAEARPRPVAGTAEAASPLRARLACGLARFDAVAAAAAARGVLGGQVGLARQTASRAQREVEGGLPADATRSLDRLEAETRALAQALGPAAPSPLSLAAPAAPPASPGAIPPDCP